MKKSMAPKDKKPTQSHEPPMVMPEIKVEPVFEVTTPAPDMEPIAQAIEKIMLPAPKIDNHFHEAERKPKRIKFTVTERDSRGLLKEFICEEI